MSDEDYDQLSDTARAYERLADAVRDQATFAVVPVLVDDVNTLLELIDRLGGPDD